MDLFKLQNGSDIRGVSISAKEGAHVDFTINEASIITGAFVHWLSAKLMKDINALKLSVGRDSRISGEGLAAKCVETIVESGASVYDCGLASTPSMFMTTVFEETNTDGAIMFTASHLPFDRNGMKFFTKDGGLDKRDIREILELASTLVLNNALVVPGVKSKYDILMRYTDHLVELVRAGVGVHSGMDTPLKDMKIVVDAGNGCGGFFIDVLEALGADTSGSQYLDPDGFFPNHIPNPEDPEAMEAICSTVMKCHADLGIIFDTDVDRAAVVDRYGRAINRNRLIALLSAIVLEHSPGATIVTDSITSDGLSRFIERRGGVHHRYKRGYKNVIDEAIRLNKTGSNAELAIETSGHGAFKSNHFLDDGAYIVVKILIELAKCKGRGVDLFSILDDLEESGFSQEIRVRICDDSFEEYGSLVINELDTLVSSGDVFAPCRPNFEGVRAELSSEGAGGWFLARMSLHDPVIPINIEADDSDSFERIKSFLRDFLSKYDKLDISAFGK